MVSRQSWRASALFTIWGAMGLINCGQQSKKTESFRPIPPRQVTIPTTPVVYTLADASCANIGLSLVEPIEITQSSIIIAEGNSAQRQFVQFQDLSTSSKYTGTDYIAGLEQGGRFLLSCDERDPNQNCRNNRFSFQLESKSRDFFICRDNFSYPENSIEFAALSVIFSLEQAQKSFERVMPDLPESLQDFPAKVLVFPDYRVRMTYTNENQELISVNMPLTDNMAYSPSKETGERKFIIYPDSHQASLKLWQSPFVIHHEFGHYLEDFLGLNPCQDNGGFLGWPRNLNKKTLGKISFPLETDDFGRGFAFTPDDSPLTQSNFCSGVSEGFADLIAYLGLLGNTKSLGELGEESLITRNPAATLFADGTAKKLSHEVFNHLKQNDQSKNPTVEVHDLGVITAHIFIGSVQRLFLVVFKGMAYSPEEIYARAYKLAIDWHIKMALSLKNKPKINDETFFGLYKETLVMAFTEFLATLQDDQNSAENRNILTLNLCTYWDSVIEASGVSCNF